VVQKLRPVSNPIIAFLRPYSLGLTDFLAMLLLIQQNLKYKFVDIQAYLPHLDIWQGIRKEL
jgi:hypothetical protein